MIVDDNASNQIPSRAIGYFREQSSLDRLLLQSPPEIPGYNLDALFTSQIV